MRQANSLPLSSTGDTLQRPLASMAGKSEDFPPEEAADSEFIRQKVKSTYGFDAHDIQVDTIRVVLEGRDAVVISGTSSGKSLIFQMLPVLRPGHFVLVFCPLLNLIYDQVHLRP